MEHYLKYKSEGYNDEQAFYLAEIETTQKMLSNLEELQDYQPTLLLNSLLSMIVLPFEKAKSKECEKIFSDDISVLCKSIGVYPTLFKPISKCRHEKVSCYRENVKTFVKKLRNGIAHQNIHIEIFGDRDFKITIRNKFCCDECCKCANRMCEKKGIKKCRDGVIDFEITVTVDQLKKIAEYISNVYLKAIKREKNKSQEIVTQG